MENISTSLFIRNPGLRTLPPGVERYYVRGGGLSVIEVLPEDKLEIINVLTEDGKIYKNAPSNYIGLDIFSARKKILEELNEKN